MTNTNPDHIETLIDDLTAEIRETNIRNGWYEDDRTFGDEIALLHSEASEALDAYREHGFMDVTDYGAQHAAAMENPALRGLPAKPEGVGSELADVFIRLLDTCDRHHIDLLAETRRKMAYNRTRGYRHGGKRL